MRMLCKDFQAAVDTPFDRIDEVDETGAEGRTIVWARPFVRLEVEDEEGIL